jgi:hypothetical protein
MAFKENLLRKIEIDRLATQVITSCGPETARHPIAKEAMRRLLEMSPYVYLQERDLDLYVKPIEGELKMILVLDNELPIFRSTIQDVVVRRSPRTLEMWRISTIRHILDDSDIKVSVRGKSVETVRNDTIAQLDLTYTDTDIEKLAIDGMAWLEGNVAGEVERSLIMFADLLGYSKPPRYFGLDRVVCYGAPATGQDKDVAFGPMAIYRPADNTLVWIDERLSRTDQQQIEFLRAVAAGESSVPVTGDAVFRKLKTDVLARPQRVLRV